MAQCNRKCVFSKDHQQVSEDTLYKERVQNVFTQVDFFFKSSKHKMENTEISLLKHSLLVTNRSAELLRKAKKDNVSVIQMIKILQQCK